MGEFIAYSMAVSITWALAVCVIKRKFLPMETGMHIAIAFGVAVAVSVPALKMGDFDSAVFTSYITGKSKDKVGCEHSYDCNPYQSCTGHGKDRVCTTKYRTCYEHSHDFKWRLGTAHFGNITISRIDRQGTKEPPRWSIANVGDPVSDTKFYTNYISAAPESLFNQSKVNTLLSKYWGHLPLYPNAVYDYYYNDKVLAVNVPQVDVKVWSRKLDQLLKKTSVESTLNVINVFVSGFDQEYADALAASWYGGKHNDVLVVTGVGTWPAAKWVRVISWSEAEDFKVLLRDTLESMPLDNADNYLGAQMEAISKGYVHKNNEDFVYLKDFIKTPMWAVWLAILVNLAANIFLTFAFHVPENMKIKMSHLTTNPFKRRRNKR